MVTVRRLRRSSFERSYGVLVGMSKGKVTAAFTSDVEGFRPQTPPLRGGKCRPSDSFA